MMCLLLLLLLPISAQAQTVSLSVPGGSINPGSTVTATAKITNALPPRPPIVLTAGCTYQDWTGTTLTATPASVTLNVVQPFSFSQLTLTMPSSLTYVPGSATAMFPVTGIVTAGVLTLAFTAPPLIEGQALSVSFGVQVAK
jgi:hypothetical protein